MKRCQWVSGDVHTRYHDTEWGVPLHSDRKIFEFLILDGMQSGLSWRIVLNKRPSFQKAFDRFDAGKMFKLKFHDKTYELNVNHKNDVMTGKLYEIYRFLEDDRIIVTKKSKTSYSLEAPDTKPYPDID